MTVCVTKLLLICSIVAMASITSAPLAEAQVYYPPAASYNIGPPVQYQAAYAPTVAYQPAACQYQTAMHQVPVTSYETRYAVDPATGYQYAYTQPVTTMQWQAPPAATQTANRPVYPTSEGITYAPRAVTATPYGYSRGSNDTSELQEWVQQLNDDVGTLRRRNARLSDEVNTLKQELAKLTERPH